MLRPLCFLMQSSRFFLAMLLCGSLSHCQQTATPWSQSVSTKRVLTLIAQTDPAGSFDGIEETLAKNFAVLPGHENRTQRISSIAALNAAIQAAAPLDGLILAFHGKPNKLHISPTESIHQRNLSEACGQLGPCLRPGAPVILYACLTGEGDDNLALDLPKTLDRPVIAPTHFWLMQTAVPLYQRVPELALDDAERLCVAQGKFALYYKKRLASGKDRYLIAHRAMNTLCLSDGFIQRASRFHPLFRRYSP